MSTAAPKKLPLKCRRALKAFEKEKLPGLLEEINKAAGTEIKMTADYPLLCTQDSSYALENFWTLEPVFYKPCIDALKSAASDDLGKAAIKASLTEIHFTYDEKTAPSSNFPNGLKFADSVLTVNFAPLSNAHAVAGRTQAILKCLEENCNVAVESKEIFPLEQARPLAKFTKELLPGFLKEIKETSKCDLKITIDEKAIALKGSKYEYDNLWFFEKRYFTPIINALKEICADEDGTEALQELLKEIVLTFDASTAPSSNYANGLKLKDGVLTINFSMSNMGYLKYRGDAIQKILEDNL